MRLYEIRIWGKYSQLDFAFLQCFSDCIPFELNKDCVQGFFDFNKEQSAFLNIVIEKIISDKQFEDEYDRKKYWLKSIEDIHTVFVIDATDNFHTITQKDLNKEI